MIRSDFAPRVVSRDIFLLSQLEVGVISIRWVEAKVATCKAPPKQRIIWSKKSTVPC